MKEEKEFEFPHKTLENIDECSNGGFVLFTFSDQGNPTVYFKFDSEKDAFAMQKHISLWINGMEHISQQITLQNIMAGSQDTKRRKK